MNKQEIFDTVARHIFTQGVPGGEKNAEGFFSCRYRGTGGTSCAVGCLIPDEAYRSWMEGNDVEGLIEQHYGRLPGWMFDHRDLLSRLQLVHDFLPAWRTSQKMRGMLYEVARKYNLDLTTLDDLKFADGRTLPAEVMEDA